MHACACINTRVAQAHGWIVGRNGSAWTETETETRGRDVLHCHLTVPGIEVVVVIMLAGFGIIGTRCIISTDSDLKSACIRHVSSFSIARKEPNVFF